MSNAQGVKENQSSVYVHGDNLYKKISDKEKDGKYGDDESQKLLKEIEKQYLVWKIENEKLKGPLRDPDDHDDEIIKKRTKLLNTYKDFLDQPRYGERFDSRSNLHSSVLEEFVYYLFRDLVKDFSNAQKRLEEEAAAESAE